MLSLTKDHRNLLSQTDCNDRCLVFAATLDHSSLMVCLHSASECLSWNGQLLQFLTLLLCDVLHDTIHHHHTGAMKGPCGMKPMINALFFEI